MVSRRRRDFLDEAPAKILAGDFSVPAKIRFFVA